MRAPVAILLSALAAPAAAGDPTWLERGGLYGAGIMLCKIEFPVVAMETVLEQVQKEGRLTQRQAVDALAKRSMWFVDEVEKNGTVGPFCAEIGVVVEKLRAIERRVK